MKEADEKHTDELIAWIRGRGHRRFEHASPGDGVADFTALTPAEAFEVTHPPCRLTPDQALALNALHELVGYTDARGAMPDEVDDIFVRRVQRIAALERLIIEAMGLPPGNLP